MLKSKLQGDEAEDELIKHIGVGASKNIDVDRRQDYDVVVDISYSSHGTAKKIGWILTFEVKNDLMASKTGNVALEYHNSKQDKPSGITATKALFWAHRIDGTIWIVPTKILLEFVATTKPFKTIKSGGDKNANLYIYKVDDFTKICKPLKDFGHIDDFLSMLYKS